MPLNLVRSLCRAPFALLIFSVSPSAFSEEPAPPPTRVSGALTIQGAPEPTSELVERLTPYLNSRSAALQDWAADGKGIYITTRFGETRQLHYVAEPGADRRQLTFFEEPLGAARVCPNPKRDLILYTRDSGGSEFAQIYAYDPKTAKSRLLTDGKSRHGVPVWNRAGDVFAYFGTARNGKDMDVYVATAFEPDRARRVTEQPGSWSPIDWSPDGTRLLVQRYVSANESHLHILDLATGDLRELRPRPEPVAYGPARWSPDGKYIYVGSDEDTVFLMVRKINVENGDFEGRSYSSGPIFSLVFRDVEALDISPDGATLAVSTNSDGVSKLYLIDTDTGKERAIITPMGLISALRFSPDGASLGMSMTGPNFPGDIFSFSVSEEKLTAWTRPKRDERPTEPPTIKPELIRWTRSEAGGLDPENFVEPEIIKYPTFDQAKVFGSSEIRTREIPAFYYKPPTATPERPAPVLIIIHGGPEGQFQPGFSPMTEFYVSQMGIAVLGPNVRGSSGYGKSYLLLDNADKREDSVKDIGALLDWIAKQPELDASRVAVMGGSYGGYMTLASMVHFDDRLRAGIDTVGISNFVSFLENTQDYRRDLRRVEYGDERDPKMREFLTRISPLTNIHKVTRPMLVAQGANDPRVPAAESEQVVAAIRKNGGDVWYMLAANEGHGFQKKVNRDEFERAVVMFLEKNLIGTK